jgi:outer membrane protein assembly factor BamA
MMIILRGNRRISSSTIFAQISIHRGDIYSPAKIERAVTGLRNTGYFDDVRVETKDDTLTKDRKIVMFFVREKKELVQPKAP